MQIYSPENEDLSELRGRILAVGDIHGCRVALETLAAAASFTDEDLVVTVGDYVDRGPDSKGVLDWLIAYSEHGKLLPLLGNHEIMMLTARENPLARGSWLGVGGFETLRSYSPESPPGKLENVPDEHWKFMMACRPFFETAAHFFVHANADPALELKKQPETLLFWERFDDPEPHSSGKHMICGHTPQLDGYPYSIGHATCIDTNAYGGGWLTALDVASGYFWQANEEGEVREAAFPEAEWRGG